MKEIKTLTMYLPQFHRVPENDKWWGEGFTEWTAVKAAQPLFPDHKQPKTPLNKYYYDLLDKKTLFFQAELMKKYGIDGQCFYHYYFKDGRKILEKPAENLLKWKDINMPFCFCWANGSWTRTWSKIRGNSWADKFEKNDGEEGLLLDQKYGREKEWKDHFEYMIPFFEDDRYIKLDGQPVLLIYNPTAIACLYQMIDYWEMLAENKGIGKLYIIGMNISSGFRGIDGVLLYAPHTFWNLDVVENGVYRPDYDTMWKKIIEKPKVEGYKTYFEGVCNCDDTPRRGNNGGVAFRNFRIETFYDGMYELYKKSMALKNEFVFINAWNEWGEGMYLEPDEENGYAYLEAVRNAKTAALREMELSESDNCNMKICLEQKTYRHDDSGRKNRLIADCLDKWLYLKEQGKCLDEFLVKNGIKTVAIYGMGILGKHLLNELEQGDIQVEYIIDRRVKVYHGDYKVRKPEDYLPMVDAIIITALGDMEKIYNELKRKVSCKLFSIRELTNEI